MPKAELIDSLETVATNELETEAASVILARRDPSFFTSYVMFDPATELNFWQDDIHIQGHQHITDWPWALIEFPREHGKTEQYVIGRTIWELGHNPNLRIKIISNTGDEGIKRVLAIASHIEKNERVRQVFPDLRPGSDNWQKSSITVEGAMPGVKDPSVESYGVFAAGTGGRSDLMIFDDICDLENTIIKPALIDKVKKAYYEKWLNLLADNSKVLYVFTRWHERDLSHELIKKAKRPEDNPGLEEYAYLKFVINDNLDSICSLWPKPRLIARRKSSGKRAFGRGFQGKAMTDEEAIFGSIDNCIDWGYYTESIPAQWPRFTGVDVGHRTKVESAYYAIFTGVISPERKKIPIECERGHWGPSEAGDRVIAHSLRHNSQIVLVENNAAQDIVISWIKEKCRKREKPTTIPVKGFFTGQQKMDPEIGLPGMVVDMENGNWIIPMGGSDHDRFGEPCRCGLCIWREEMKSWPVPVHFDCGMASWLWWNAVSGFHYGGKSVSTGKPREMAKGMSDYGPQG